MCSIYHVGHLLLYMFGALPCTAVHVLSLVNKYSKYIHPSMFICTKNKSYGIMQARQKSWTERSMNDAHNCPKT